MACSDSASLPPLDLLDVGVFAAGHPHEAYDRVRAAEPVMRHPGSAAVPPFRALTRHADIQQVSLDAANFTSTRGFRLPTAGRARMDPEIGRLLSRFMLAMDRPEHDAYRGLVSHAFLPHALAALEPRIAQSVDALMAGLEPGQDVDFVTGVAAAVPIRTVCALLGVPPEDEAKVFDLTNAVFGTDDPDYAQTPEEANRRYQEVVDYAGWMIARREREPRDDLTSVFAHAAIDGRPIDPIEKKSFFTNMLAAGNETTRSSLAGAIWGLARFPGERARLIADPGLIPGAINELLRWFSPVIHMARTATADTDVGGTAIGAGERVVLLYGAGNHDPAVFADPHRLDVGRANAGRHLTFGFGIHHCLGARLAAMQLRLLIGAFLRRFPRYELTGAPVFLASNFVQAMKALPMRLAA